MPESFDFVDTFDLFFKVHKIFNQSFESHVMNMMKFIQHAIFEMSERGLNPTNRMKEIANMMN